MKSRAALLVGAVVAAVGLVLGLVLTVSAANPARGQGMYDLDPALAGVQPSAFTFDKDHFVCAVSFGTMGAKGPGPFSEPKMKLADVNFAMVVTATKINKFKVNKKSKTVTIEGVAHSMTTVDDAIAENARYRFVATAVDKGPGTTDTMLLQLFAPKGATGLFFDKASFGTTQGLLSGDVVLP